MRILLLAYKKISSSEKYYLRLKEELEKRFEKVMYGFIAFSVIIVLLILGMKESPMVKSTTDVKS